VTAVDRSEPAVRVFYALVPPPSLQQVLGHLAVGLAHRVHGRPVPPENIHATLAFIGAWPAERLPLLLHIGSGIDAAAARITLDVLGGFRRAAVAWIGASSTPPTLLELARTLAGALSAIGIAQDERPYQPHLTLARKCRGPYPHDAVGPFAWDADHVALMRSETRRDGARYTMLAQWTLGREVAAR
jgi:2'-5' RNA ligase